MTSLAQLALPVDEWISTQVHPDHTHHLRDGYPIYSARFSRVLKFHPPGLAAVKDATGSYHIKPDGIRSAPFVGRATIPSGEMVVFSELSFPPLGYILTKDDYKAPGVAYQRLDFLSRYRYADWKTVPLRMPYLPTATWVPGDIRTRDEAEACARADDQFI